MVAVTLRTLEDGTVLRLCTKCMEELPLERFNIVRGQHHGHCRSCKTAYNMAAARAKGVRAMNPAPIVDGRKRCRKCAEFKQLSAFAKQANGRGGAHPWCKQCVCIDQRAKSRVQGIKEKVFSRIDGESKLCMNCLQMKSFCEFYKSKRGSAGVGSYCRPCHIARFHSRDKGRASTARWRENNRPRWLSMHRLHQFKRRMAQEARDDGSATDTFLIDLYMKPTCAYCLMEIEPRRRTADHVIPLARGGWHSATNLVMACLPCNSAKAKRTDVEFCGRAVI